jgi:two-component system chemotaxis response regulator CheB
MIKVLIADDSMLVRLVLRDLLARDPEIQVADGRQAVEETARLRPDLVIMDVMMPVMDGLAAVVEIMAACPTPILVLSSNVDPRDSRSAFNAIQHGALDVMEKPQGLVSEAYEEIAARLIERVKFLSRVKVIHHFRRKRSAAVPPPLPSNGHRSVLAIGASTGGPKAVLRLMADLPAAAQARVLIVQHIAKGFAAGFAEWLDRESPYRVRLARDGDPLEGGVALVAPNGVHLEVEGERVHLAETEPVNCCRPSVDVLFRSLARSPLAPATVAVLLTGMGRDGADGMAELRARGAFNIAQDEASSAVFGMPRAAIALGVVDRTLPLGEIPAVLRQLLRPAVRKDL